MKKTFWIFALMLLFPFCMQAQVVVDNPEETDEDDTAIGAILNGEAQTGVMPKAISVGGTWMSSKVPLMESFPPMDGRPSESCIRSAPSNAESGLPQVCGSFVIRSKYS